jgi:hypothetical protein
MGDVKRFLAWRKSKGFDPGTTLYTDRVQKPLATRCKVRDNQNVRNS